MSWLLSGAVSQSFVRKRKAKTLGSCKRLNPSRGLAIKAIV